MISYPEKQYDFLSRHMDSRIWNDFVFRSNDIIIASYAKSGTTWLQQIVGQLLFKGRPDVPIQNVCPWLEYRDVPADVKIHNLEKQQHRRFIKTHLPVHSMPLSKQAKYLYIARDGRDVLFSLYNHHKNANQDWYDFLNSQPNNLGPKFTKPSEQVSDYYRHWLENDGQPFWPYWENVRSWWNVRDLPNVKLVHFADLKEDLEQEIKNIADFLQITIDKNLMRNVLKHSSFEYMKKHAERVAPLGGRYWVGGAKTFINKGVNGSWKKVLTAEESRKYVDAVKNQLGSQCAKWLLR
ncbi:MAG TPA: sulfotransferase domain-containing protein [Candidatus Paceibacterota bacterium]|nr:sulfotransferase domain-containing protein [Candidatus Paceibacterota bacterium]HMO82536.1 sulfotransferase domain-containing protein [Candidatus Paceibacterota bacterium]